MAAVRCRALLYHAARVTRMDFRFQARLWLYEGAGAWHFVTLPTEIADVIREMAQPPSRGFGSVRVAVTIGQARWHTSIFPDSKSGSYVMPVKKQVRVAERLSDGDLVEVIVDIADL